MQKTDLKTKDFLRFQTAVTSWMLRCFGRQIAADKQERNCRFLEEALELVQAGGLSKSEALQLVDYTYGRPVGVLDQEVGGVMVTLSALCSANNLSLGIYAYAELDRVCQPEVMEKIRAKQSAKPKFSPLPEGPR